MPSSGSPCRVSVRALHDLVGPAAFFTPNTRRAALLDRLHEVGDQRRVQVCRRRMDFGPRYLAPLHNQDPAVEGVGGQLPVRPEYHELVEGHYRTEVALEHAVDA